MIPEGWKRKSLGEIAEISSGSTPLRQKDEYWNGTIPWVTTGEIDYQIIESTKEKITELAYEECCLKIHPPGTILIAMYGQGITRGRIAILGISGTTNQACCAIRLDSSTDNKFIYFQLEHLYPEIRKLGHGGNQQNLNGQIIKQISIIIPPLPEQHKIAEILSTWDKALALLEQLITAKRKLKQGLMQQLLTGKKRFKESEGSEWDKIPEGWKIELGKNIASKITKGQSPKWQGFEYQDSGTLFVTSENVRDGKLDISKPKYLSIAFNDKLKISQLKKGDILINIVGASIGRSCQFDVDIEYANINQAVCLFRTKDTINSHYIAQFLQLPNTIIRLLGTQSESARPNLSLRDIQEFYFLLPPLPEQQKIASILSTADTEISNLEKQLAAYKQQKRGLMQQLLTGKKRVKLDESLKPEV